MTAWNIIIIKSKESKKMKIIALWGKHDSGKTTTIKLFRDILLKGGAKERKIVEGYDFISEFTIQGKKVGVISGGDTKEILEGNFGQLSKGCDVVICPSRTKGETVHYLENSVLSKGDLIWIRKARIESTGKYCIKRERDAVNLLQAEILYEELKLQL